MRIYIPEDAVRNVSGERWAIVDGLPYCSPSGMAIDNGSVHLRLV